MTRNIRNTSNKKASYYKDRISAGALGAHDLERPCISSVLKHWTGYDWLIKKQTYMKTETCKLHSRVFSLFPPNVNKSFLI